jgi:hypothetical protein
MKKNWAAFSFVLLALFLLAGCATPVDKSEITPKLIVAEKNLAVSVVEGRPYVLDGSKTPKFEGIVRGAFGIPMTVDRPGPKRSGSSTTWPT